MKPLNFIHPSIVVAKAKGKGKGVFANDVIAANEIIEVAPVIVLSVADREHVEQTLLHDYIFEWGEDKKSCIIALGYVSVYNHSYTANCEYLMDYEKEIIWVKTIRETKKGEELSINYNGNWDNPKKVWFKTK